MVEFYNKSYTYNGSSGYLDSTTTKVVQPTEEELNESYSYDVRGRLVEVEADQTNEGIYGYSSTGNLTNNFGSTQTFNTGNRLTSTPQNYYSFDGRGNRTKDVTSNATVNMTFNQEDKLTSWTKGSTNVQYQYDANGLIKKRTQGSTNQNFIWDYNNSVPLLLDDGKYEYLYGESNTPVAQIEKSNGKVTYLHADSLGTVTFATKANGDQAALYVYDAYGKFNTSWSTDVSRTVTRFGYAGEWADPTTGLYNLRARWYEPTTGTFLSEDPLVQFTNEAYGYSSGNPLLYTDPLGLFSQEWESGQARQRFFASEGFKSFVNGFTSAVITGGAIVLGAACIAATAGICGGAIGSALVIGAIGAGSSSLDYALTERCQSPQGWMAAAVVGGLTGGKGKAFTAVGKKAVREGQAGAYNTLGGFPYDDLTAHHMPSRAHLQNNMGYTKNEADAGGSIVMRTKDHYKTRTYGDSKIHKAEANLDPNVVLQRDIDDYLSITKNQKAVDDLLEWHKKNSSWYKG